MIIIYFRTDSTNRSTSIFHIFFTTKKKSNVSIPKFNQYFEITMYYAELCF